MDFIPHYSLDLTRNVFSSAQTPLQTAPGKHRAGVLMTLLRKESNGLCLEKVLRQLTSASRMKTGERGASPAQSMALIGYWSKQTALYAYPPPRLGAANRAH